LYGLLRETLQALGCRMTFRRRPIPKSRVYPEVSQHYETILDGAIRKYRSSGREVCNDSPAGWREYSRRIDAMLIRQNWICCDCGKKIRSRSDATFEHQRRRGMGAAFRDDRIMKDGKEWNGAAHWVCNSERG
jgi:hypothetical protein